MKKTYYTVILVRGRYRMKYAQAPLYVVQTLEKEFDTSGQATGEFKQMIQGEYEYLSEQAFGRKVSLLSQHYQQELARLKVWNARSAQ